MPHHLDRTHPDTDPMRQAIDIRLASLCQNRPNATRKPIRAAVLAPGRQLRPVIVRLTGGDDPAAQRGLLASSYDFAACR